MMEKYGNIIIIVTLDGDAVRMAIDKNEGCDDDEDDDVCWYNVLSSVSSHNNMVNLETC